MTIKVPIVSSLDDRGFKDAERAIARLEKAGGTAGGWAKATQVANQAVPVLNAALVGLAGAAAIAVKAASDQEQAFGGLEAVYGSSAGAMQQWAKTTKDIGISAADSAQAATRFGASLTAAGFTIEEAAAQSQKLVGLGADLAATFGGTATEATTALGAAMRGEFDPIERFGVVLRQADVDARLAAKGQSDLEGAALATQKAIAIQEIIWEQTAAAQGQATREMDTAAGAAARARASMTDAGAAIAEDLLPPLADLAGKLAGAADWAGRNTGAVVAMASAIVALRVAIALNNVVMGIYINRQIYASAATTALAVAQRIGTLIQIAATVATAALQVAVQMAAAAIWRQVTAAAAATAAWLGNTAATIANTAANVAARVALGVWRTAVAVATAAQWAWNIAMSANPIGLIILAIIAAIAIIVAMVAAIRHLWNTNEGFRNAVTGIWNAVRDAVGRAVGGIKDYIDGAIDRVRALWDWFQRLRDSAGRALGAINPFGAGGGGYVPMAPVAAAYRRSPEAQEPAQAVAPRVTDEQLARALMRLLNRSSARQGVVFAG